ncbi:Dabb family protein [Nocardia sp. bgisy118]|uniref:Dabb family protein n=1 Tax=Nocardia sp. bgisy118 TaxID=3413786 RepID=UPI003F4A01C1
MAIPSYPEGAVVHTVIIAWKGGAVDDQLIDYITSELRDVGENSDGVLDYRVGSDLGVRFDHGDYAVTAIFENQASFDAYVANSRHIEIVEEYLLPNVERHMTALFEI